LVERAERSNYKAIVVTTGCPVVGKRDRNIRNRFSLPKTILAANFKKSSVVVHNNPIHSIDGAELDPSVTWKDIEWLRCNSRLPIIIKGIMNPLDVAPALDLNVSGIIVSNHGGRQLDTSESTIGILPEVARAVAGRVPLLVVLLGRPVLWALAVDGEKGVVDAVNLLTEELRVAMQIAGCSSLDEIKKNSTTIVRRQA
jgi:(S)-2-hydroxy-acid oxidase/4-hydroxymandelate oxidase